MGKRSIIILALMMSGCAKPIAASVDPEIFPYFDRFMKATGVTTYNIKASFSNLENSTMGICTIDGDDAREITINQEQWDQASEDQREELIMHELGHCAMGLHHVTDMLPSGCPASVMYPYSFFGCYKEHKAYYTQDLRARRR